MMSRSSPIQPLRRWSPLHLLANEDCGWPSGTLEMKLGESPRARLIGRRDRPARHHTGLGGEVVILTRGKSRLRGSPRQKDFLRARIPYRRACIRDIGFAGAFVPKLGQATESSTGFLKHHLLLFTVGRRLRNGFGHLNLEAVLGSFNST